APKGFQWEVLPPLKGTSTKQAANPQTLSVPAEGKHIEQSAKFIDYFMKAENLAAVGQGDWLIPTTQAARDAVQKATVGDAELEVPKRIHAMAYDDKSIDPTSLTQGGTDVLPGFYAGKYGMIVAGNYVGQQILSEAPKGFQWEVLPPLKGTSSKQAANPQTLSVPAEGKHVEQSAKFIDYFMKAENLAAVGQGDWLIPSTQAARDAIQKATGGKNGWQQTLASGTELTKAPFQSVDNYPKWKDQIATPAFQEFLANKTDLAGLGKKLSDGWGQVNN
ncbi:MAG TPA: extracellular solute-binding protein, partial [Kribbella sp.]|nr:extracellular solute-binding protein [Kribbella sp.]